MFIVLVSLESLHCNVSGCELERENINLFPVQDLIAPPRLASGYDSGWQWQGCVSKGKAHITSWEERLREETQVPLGLHVCSSGGGASHGPCYLMGHSTPVQLFVGQGTTVCMQNMPMININ